MTRRVAAALLVLTLAVLVAAVVPLALGTVVHVSPLMLGLVLVFAATGTAFIVPWGRSPVGLELVLPLVDRTHRSACSTNMERTAPAANTSSIRTSE